MGIARGVFASEATRDASGALTLRAEPEPDAAGFPALGELASAAPMSEAERIRRIGAYREYLRSRGQTPRREVRSTADAAAVPEPAPVEKAETPEEPAPKDLPAAYQ